MIGCYEGWFCWMWVAGVGMILGFLDLILGLVWLWDCLCPLFSCVLAWVVGLVVLLLWWVYWCRCFWFDYFGWLVILVFVDWIWFSGLYSWFCGWGFMFRFVLRLMVILLTARLGLGVFVVAGG